MTEDPKRLDRAELLRRQKEVDEKRRRDRNQVDRQTGKRHRHAASSAHFRLRSGRKG